MKPATPPRIPPQTTETPGSHIALLQLIANELALDFVNTSSGRGHDTFRENLQEPAHVIEWAHKARILHDSNRDFALRLIVDTPKAGAALFKAAHKLREAIYRIAGCLANGVPPTDGDRAAISDLHAKCLRKAHLTPAGQSFVWVWNPQDGLTESILGPVALSALTLLTQQDLARVKRCQGERCGWLFFDTTKNRSRRWCEMEICGNRAKVRAHRQRKCDAPDETAT